MRIGDSERARNDGCLDEGSGQEEIEGSGQKEMMGRKIMTRLTRPVYGAWR